MKFFRIGILAFLLIFSSWETIHASERIVTFSSSNVANNIIMNIPSEIEHYELTPEIYMFNFPSDELQQKWEQYFSTSPFVNTIERNMERTLTNKYDDEYLQDQWWIHELQLPRAWELEQYAKQKATIAIIDSGLAEHPDFENSRIHPDSYDFLTRSKQLQDPNGHGTSIAGIIGATTFNGVGVASTIGNFPIDILVLRIMDEKGKTKVSHIVEAIHYATKAQANVINLSLGGVTPSTAEQKAIRQATEAGILVVTSGGNDALKGNPLNYPAAYPETIAVAATDSNLKRAPFSNYHPYISFAAPGVQLLTISNRTTTQYDYVSGTSFASPIVSGTIAMMQTVAPSASKDEISLLLQRTAVDLGRPGKDSSFGYGLIQPASAIEAAIHLEQEKILPQRINGGTKKKNEPIIIYWNDIITAEEAKEAIIIRNHLGKIIPFDVTQNQYTTSIAPIDLWKDPYLYIDIPAQKIGDYTLHRGERYFFTVAP